jgi:hypothetical protein
VLLVQCDNSGIKLVNVPWARPGRSLTKLLHAFTKALPAHNPVNAPTRTLIQHDTRPWRKLNHYDQAARPIANISHIPQNNVDDTASRRGQH